MDLTRDEVQRIYDRGWRPSPDLEAQVIRWLVGEVGAYRSARNLGSGSDR
jgi:hypothetical protein